MKYILEGPDGAGKTTLADSLGDSWHHSYYPDARVMFTETLRSIISDKKSVDRLYYSELVYSPIYHKTPQRYGNRTRMLDRMVLSEGRIIIACLPDYETCHAAWSSGREEMVSDEAQFKAIYDAYAAMKYNTPHVTYDWKKETLDDLAEKLAAVEVYENKGPGIGNFKPGNILIVGDTASNPLIDNIDLPFVHWDGCSPWLAMQLDYAGVPESELYWVNGFRLDGGIQSKDFVDELQPRLIVALGEEAARWCEIADLKYTRVEHPQYWKRFRHADQYPLVNLLRGHYEED
jgi:adenylate kinase family enzyme